MSSSNKLEDQTVPFLQSKDQSDDDHALQSHNYYQENINNVDEHNTICLESKKLWHIVGPAIISRVTNYGMLIVTQAFAGHLGDLELAAFAIGVNVIVGFDHGLLVLLFITI